MKIDDLKHLEAKLERLQMNVNSKISQSDNQLRKVNYNIGFIHNKVSNAHQKFQICVQKKMQEKVDKKRSIAIHLKSPTLSQLLDIPAAIRFPNIWQVQKYEFFLSLIRSFCRSV